MIQSAINVSEGRRPAVVEEVADAVRRTPGAMLADYSADEDHNRMVVTVLGGPAAIQQAALAVARVAVERIDLRHHTGAHPRIGAVDVIPVTPLRGTSLAECIDLSREIGQQIADELALPVYFYESSANPDRPSLLPEIRKGGFEGLFSAELAGSRLPDAGPHVPHPTAGAVIVGARAPLVAYNVDLMTADVSVARRVAARIRAARAATPDLAGVRALGLWLPRRARAQVSMNITRPYETPLPALFDVVRSWAEDEGAEVWGSEIIGLIPQASLGGEAPERILWRGYRPTLIVEFWLAKL